jgi:hypothetical protein
MYVCKVKILSFMKDDINEMDKIEQQISNFH